jgi:hypothetical protein
MKNDKNMNAMALKFEVFRERLSMSRLKKQAGELSLMEAGAVLGAAALLALAVYVAVPYVRNMVQTYHFKSEASLFHTGIQNATESDANFAAETLQSLAQGHAFDAAGARVSSDFATVSGLFGQPITISIGNVVTANDAVILGYTVPSAVCAMAAGTMANVFTQVDIGATTVYSPTIPFNSGTASAACASQGSTATFQLYTTRS